MHSIEATTEEYDSLHQHMQAVTRAVGFQGKNLLQNFNSLERNADFRGFSAHCNKECLNPENGCALANWP